MVNMSDNIGKAIPVLHVDDTEGLTAFIDDTFVRGVARYLRRVWDTEDIDVDAAAAVMRHAMRLPATDHDVANYCDLMYEASRITLDPAEWAMDHMPEDGPVLSRSELAEWAMEQHDSLLIAAARSLTLVVGAR